MAQATVLGSLLVQLGMDSAQFERASQRAQSTVQKMAASINVSAKDVVAASNRMGISVTAFAGQVAALQTRLNPGNQALANYRREMGLLREALRIGAITQDQFRTSVQTALTSYRAAGQGVAATSGSMKAGMQQLGFQLNDVATQFASGTKPMQIFGQQAGQIIQSVQLMTNSTSKFGAFMAGPWGIAITAGVIVLSSLVAKLFETKNAMDAVGKAAADAMEQLRVSMAASSKFSDAINKAGTDRINAMAREAKAVKALQAAREEAASTPGYGGTVGGAGAAGVSATSRIAKAEAELKAARADIKTANSQLDEIDGLVAAAAMQEKAREANNKRPEKEKKPRKGRTPDTQTDFEQSRDLGQYEAEILRARLDLARTAESRAELETQMLDLEKTQRYAEVEADKSLSEAQRKALKAKLETLYGPQTPAEGEITVGNGLLYQMQQRQIADDNLRMAQESRARQADALDAVAAINPSLRERARIEAEVLRLMQQTETELLEQQIANGKVTDADQARAQLAQKQAADRENLTQRNLGPMDAYRQRLRESAANVNEAIEEIGVSGLESLNSQLAEALVNFDNLGKVAQNVFKQMLADIIRLQLQRNLSAGFGSIIGSIGKLFGVAAGVPALGNAGGGFGGNADFSTPISFAGARANGGPVRAGLPYLVGERGPEPFIPDTNGRIMSNEDLRGLGGASIQVVPSPYFDVVVDGRAANVAAPMASQAASAGSAGAQVALARKQSRVIP